MLQLRDVTRRYGERVAVDGLTLDVQPGEIFGLLGPNGAGKSTTVHLAVGLLRPDAGEILIGAHGAPIDPAVRRRIGVAPQNLAIYEGLTGRENLEFFGALYGLRGKALAGRVSGALAFVGLEDRARHRVHTYSGGMKRRLNLAAAIVHEPELVLLDEPTVGVDPQSRNAIFGHIETLRARGTTVVYTTHYMEEAARLCDRVAIVDRGRVLAVDTVPGLVARHGGPPTLVATVDGEERRITTDAPVETLSALAGSGRVSAFTLEHVTLEQVFLRLTGKTLRD